MFQQETLNYLMSMINKDPIEDTDLHGKKIISDLGDVVSDRNCLE